MPETAGILPRVMNSNELTRLIAISIGSVNYLARKGIITGHKVGRRWCFKVF